MSESEFDRKFWRTLVEKNQNQSARIHRDMCTMRSEQTKINNQEL